MASGGERPPAGHFSARAEKYRKKGVAKNHSPDPIVQIVSVTVRSIAANQPGLMVGGQHLPFAPDAMYHLVNLAQGAPGTVPGGVTTLDRNRVVNLATTPPASMPSFADTGNIIAVVEYRNPGMQPVISALWIGQGAPPTVIPFTQIVYLGGGVGDDYIPGNSYVELRAVWYANGTPLPNPVHGPGQAAVPLFFGTRLGNGFHWLPGGVDAQGRANIVPLPPSASIAGGGFLESNRFATVNGLRQSVLAGGYGNFNLPFTNVSAATPNAPAATVNAIQVDYGTTVINFAGRADLWPGQQQGVLFTARSADLFLMLRNHLLVQDEDGLWSARGVWVLHAVYGAQFIPNEVEFSAASPGGSASAVFVTAIRDARAIAIAAGWDVMEWLGVEGPDSVPFQ